MFGKANMKSQKLSPPTIVDNIPNLFSPIKIAPRGGARWRAGWVVGGVEREAVHIDAKVGLRG